jgi:hypothetical protein
MSNGSTILRNSFLALAIFLTMTCSLPAQEKRPKIAASVLCGVVTDLAGAPIPKARVAAMWGDFGTSTNTDQSGRWSFGKGTGPHWMTVDAEGFQTFIFDYVDKAEPKNSGADKPAFIVHPKDGTCPTPIYVRPGAARFRRRFGDARPAKNSEGKEGRIDAA